MKKLKKIAFIFLLILFSTLSYSQEKKELKPLKNWNSIGVRARILPKVNLSFTQLYGFNTQAYRLSFLQNSYNITKYLKNKWSVGLGHNHTFVFKSSSTDIKYRFNVVARYRESILGNRINNSLMLEYHSKHEHKFRYRVIYSLQFTPKINALYTHLKLKTFMSFKLYYNIGGEPISQFTSQGKYVGEFVPYGWHRARLTLYASYRPTDYMSVLLSLMRQYEFNTDFALRNRIHAYHPEKDKTYRKFSEYYMLGLSLRFHTISKVTKKWDKKQKRKGKNNPTFQNWEEDEDDNL